MVISQIIPLASFIGLILSSIWLVFFLLEDRVRPEPKLIITKTFVIGMVSALAAAGIEKLLSILYIANSIGDYSMTAIFSNAFAEEFVKFMVVWIFISIYKEFDEPIDYMIYMIVAALGFAMVENIFFLSAATGLSQMIGISILRFVGATLMHALSSGIHGSFWAKGLAPIGLIIATLIHGTFNVLVMKTSPELIPITFLIVVAFVVLHEFDKIKEYYYERKRG